MPEVLIAARELRAEDLVVREVSLDLQQVISAADDGLVVFVTFADGCGVTYAADESLRVVRPK